MRQPFVAFVTLAIASVLAVPSPVVKRATTVEPVSAATESALTIYAQFARAAYCEVTNTWSCGAACNAISGFKVQAYGGDGDAVPRWYVGYWPAKKTAVVSHEGTDPTQFLSLLNDAEAEFTTLSSTLFPGLSSSIQVHDGFATAQAASATAVLAAVKQIFSAQGISSVTLTGHSLGSAIASIDAVYLKLNLPSSTTFKTVIHGTPRVGNQAFANYIDATFSDFTRITHNLDPIAIVPGRFLGYHHASGEDHIESDNSWEHCDGQDNTSTLCSTGAVPNILEGNIVDHLGPYNGIWYVTNSASDMLYALVSLTDPPPFTPTLAICRIGTTFC
ncbi:alpha beta-hydrolase [Clavulina sp. PMI_390]|nr:alpha beta-hydrolase [Clavulina sp. PMI_390]